MSADREQPVSPEEIYVKTMASIKTKYNATIYAIKEFFDKQELFYNKTIAEDVDKAFNALLSTPLSGQEKQAINHYQQEYDGVKGLLQDHISFTTPERLKSVDLKGFKPDIKDI